jgi:hypothetical protein
LHPLSDAALRRAPSLHVAAWATEALLRPARARVEEAMALPPPSSLPSSPSPSPAARALAATRAAQVAATRAASAAACQDADGRG